MSSGRIAPVFGVRIRNRRVRCGLSRLDVARALDCSENRVRQIENGDIRALAPYQLLTLARVLQVAPEEVGRWAGYLGGDDDFAA